MPPKRKKIASAAINGVAASEKLKRHPLHNSIARWDWVGSEVTQTENITLDHRMASCNLSPGNRNILCHNKYNSENDVDKTATLVHEQGCSRADGELEDDIIVISDDDEPVCSKKVCKCNPYCLNYLAQDMWEDEETAMEKFMELANLGENPLLSSREPVVPVGLKNLGATCYANASLQVWFRFAAFRSGVYGCEPPETIPQEKYKDSPIFQLQVTFAALQDGNQKVFNPTRLVESLQLRASEQQDAQEFAKLFMTHLDAEFKKQTSSALKSLITNQFQGTQVYGTICHSCRHRSETTSEFLEIEISFKNNAKLEDCISDSLLPEKLSGENQYLCSQCASLRDATRYTELRKLPPVLHFSLMRFVYDLNTMERKKSKHSISFPSNLDMSKFLGSRDRDLVTSRNCEEDIYELRGVLLHKGASAYHGHYEAQVYDAEHGSWFLCNDEFVTKINGLGEKIPPKRDNDKNSDEDVRDSSDTRKKRVNTRKRRRIEDSDDDVIEVKPRNTPKGSERSNLIMSKDAYMLIYAKREFLPKLDNQDDSAINSIPKPSSRALQVVQDLNNAHQIACTTYLERENAAKTRFAELRRRVRSIYKDWMTEPSSGSIIVSRQALEAWLSTHCIAASLAQEEGGIVPESESSMKRQNKISISSTEIICEHGYLNPKRSDDMKCISLHAYEKLKTGTNCAFTPALSPSEVCFICVSVEFRERLYHREHPRHIKEVDDVANVGEGEFGYWISKKWYKDWRLLKPRMHVLSQDDPAPDSSEFYNHVYCEHAKLTLNLTNRRKISAQAVALLQKLFPKWDPLATNADPCAICETEIHLSKEDKREIRRRIEDEKARLRFILEPSLDAWTKRHDDFYAILSIQFAKNWKRWICSPLEHQRPEGIDNTSFFCQHKLLAIDPNCSGDLDPSVIIIQRDEWDVLNSIYEGGPLIALSKKITDNGSNYQHDIPVCEDCRTRRKTEWDTADVVIRYIDPNGSKQKPMVTYSSTYAVRQSKRLRQNREDGKRKFITITKSSTVKDIKIMVQEEFSLPAICQRLFYQGKELDDNSATVESLRIFANDIIDLREAEEMVDLTSDCDESPPKKPRKEEGNGFNGTLLGNADAPWSSSPEESPHQTDGKRTCPACTFSNTSDAVSCQICDNFLSEY